MLRGTNPKHSRYDALIGQLRRFFTITLSDDELNDDTSGANNISGLLSFSRYFQRATALSLVNRFRVRGLNTDNGAVLMNGIEMNKMFDGRPQWSNWGGLNDVLRGQELSMGLAPSSYTFGGLLGQQILI